MNTPKWFGLIGVLALVTLALARGAHAQSPQPRATNAPTPPLRATRANPSAISTQRSPTAQANSETSRFGLNPGIGALDWDPAEMFADVMKTFRAVTQPDGVTPVAVDAQGWPLADCRFLVWHGITRPAETYHLKFTGSASTIAAAGATIQNQVYDAPTNTTTADVLLDGSNALYLTFTGTSGGVKNVQLMMPDHTFGEIWNHAFLSALAPAKVIRLMDFTATNWNHAVNWSDRTLPTAVSQQSHPAGYGWQGKGICWEYAIDLLNTTDKDGWINIPAEATDAYVNSLIALIKNGGNGFAPLEAERKLYIEYSNEVWNGIFDQAINRSRKTWIGRTQSSPILNLPRRMAFTFATMKARCISTAIRIQIGIKPGLRNACSTGNSFTRNTADTCLCFSHSPRPGKTDWGMSERFAI
jgi:hypothetical protein